ncbi:sensor histidine kinase [Geoalkalibacter sp.]|uniref:sensor histidine kinase n=1 Tax=Geoalkalibacter sp. TaxID=3041440 RepID=UPI00272E157A|nr:ATP-binding protein [Geoalkalibacter sp.]
MRILVVEDDPAHVLAITRAFKAPDSWVDIAVAGSLRDYRLRVAEQVPQIVLMDLNLPDGRAVDLLSHAGEERPFPVLILTAQADEKIAVAAMKAGALDYIVKSPGAFAELPRTVGRALREWNLCVREKQAQAEVLRASQLASIGELAAGVAHEINNPVNGVINYAQMLVNRLGGDEVNRQLAEGILREGDRIAAIVGSLLAFARPQAEAKRPVDLGELLKDCLLLVGAQLRKEGIVFGIEVAVDVPAIAARKQHLQQVFLNLISNARYALNEKYPGKNPDKVLEIRVDMIETSKGFVRISFHDHGVGVPRHLRDKVFNPFFTTKPADRGTGLGLSISYGIIKDHGGRLLLDSEEGSFTTLSIELPLRDAEAIRE